MKIKTSRAFQSDAADSVPYISDEGDNFNAFPHLIGSIIIETQCNFSKLNLINFNVKSKESKEKYNDENPRFPSASAKIYLLRLESAPWSTTGLTSRQCVIKAQRALYSYFSYTFLLLLVSLVAAPWTLQLRNFRPPYCFILNFFLFVFHLAFSPCLSFVRDDSVVIVYIFNFLLQSYYCSVQHCLTRWVYTTTF